jgi:phage baseplate assembly protein gpV
MNITNIFTRENWSTQVQKLQGLQQSLAVSFKVADHNIDMFLPSKGQQPTEKLIMSTSGVFKSITAQVIPGKAIENRPAPGTTAPNRAQQEQRLSTEIVFKNGTTLSYDNSKNRATVRSHNQVSVFPNTSVKVKIGKPSPQGQSCEITITNSEMVETIQESGETCIKDLANKHMTSLPRIGGGRPWPAEEMTNSYIISPGGGVSGTDYTPDHCYEARAELVDGTIQTYSHKSRRPKLQLTPFLLALED